MADPIQDGRFLHFLKELPAWCVIGLFVGAFLVVWNFSHDDFIPRIIDGLVGALLTSIIAQRPKQVPTINADAVNTDSMDNAAVNADTINLTDKKGE